MRVPQAHTHSVPPPHTSLIWPPGHTSIPLFAHALPSAFSALLPLFPPEKVLIFHQVPAQMMGLFWAAPTGWLGVPLGSTAPGLPLIVA